MFCSEESGDSSDCPQGWALGGEFPLSLDEAARCPHSPHRPGPSHQVTASPACSDKCHVFRGSENPQQGLF